MEHYGNMHQRNATDIGLAGISTATTVAAVFNYEGKLSGEEAGIQIALLYTTKGGERRIRVHNMNVPIVNDLHRVFRYADLDAIVTYLAKASVAVLSTATARQVREQLTERCVKILVAYRKHCAKKTSPGQVLCCAKL